MAAASVVHPNSEAHFTASEIVKDVVIGMADGLTVPFALAAGISGAVDSISIIVTAGLAEIAAGAIAMGLGGYMAARTSEQHYATERQRELFEIDHMYERERDETREIFSEYGLSQDQVNQIVDTLAQNKQKWADFMMRYELGLEKPDTKRAPISALTIGASYIIGGFIPLAPYMILQDVSNALTASIWATTAALAAFGAVKGKLIGVSALKASIQTMCVGGLAAAVAYNLAAYISH